MDVPPELHGGHGVAHTASSGLASKTMIYKGTVRVQIVHWGKHNKRGTHNHLTVTAKGGRR